MRKNSPSLTSSFSASSDSLSTVNAFQRDASALASAAAAVALAEALLAAAKASSRATASDVYRSSCLLLDPSGI